MMIDTSEVPMATFPCHGHPRPNGITLSWSRLSDWTTCKKRVKLFHDGKRQKFVNARNFLAGNLVDNTMREALTYSAVRDDAGRLVELSKEDFVLPLESKWYEIVNNPEKNTVYKWQGDIVTDQRRILKKAEKALDNLYPIVMDKLMGKRYIPEFRPSEMPPVGVPGPDGETYFIRLFLAVDMAVQVEEDKDDPDNGIGKWGLYDLKTTEQDNYLKKTLPQLVFYDIAFQALTGSQPVEHALWAPLTKDPIKVVEVDDSHRRQVMDWIISYCHSVWAGEDEMTTDDTACYMCPTKAACPKFVKPLKKDEQGIFKVAFGSSDEGMLQ